jgi:hypothetical protein
MTKIHDTPYTFAGMPVVVHEAKIVTRTWKERLFSRPWRPFRNFKIVPPAIPDGQVFRVVDTWHMTVVTWNNLMRELERVPRTLEM